MPAMWSHLAQRADLARNIREVQLCARQDYTAPDRFPVSLVDSSPHKDKEEKRIDNLCTALSHMKRLTTFVWQYEADAKAGLRTLNHCHEEMVLSSLGQIPNLRHLMLEGQCGAHVRDGKGARRELYPHLEVPMELDGLDTCHLPRLKRVALPMTLGATATSFDGVIVNSVIKFLHCNSTIEELNWNTVLTSLLPPDMLPNLRPIKCLDVWNADVDCLTKLQTFDASTLRKLKIPNVRSLGTLRNIAQKFVGITWLWLPVLAEYGLVLRGPVLWGAVGGNTEKERMHIAISDLIERCPRLRQLDHCSYHEKRKAAKLIKIHRKQDTDSELEQVWYEVLRPPPGYVFVFAIIVIINYFVHFSMSSFTLPPLTLL
ncbi:hypothetical protein C0995_007033 [Termitomyces sp. Mi166|nr:hypothetical protein C0995_007033 [Termitomyces sp. Mi166\